MNIGQAVEAMKDGHRVARAGWNGKGMYIFVVEGMDIDWQGAETRFNDAIAMFTAAREIQPGWLCSQADLLATDWTIV